MARELPGNLKLLYEAFSKEAIDSILGGDSFTEDGVEFVCAYQVGSTPERFYMVKSPALVERYRQLCAGFTNANIMELGIAEGGSTAFMALVADLHRLVAIDLDTEPLDALTAFLEQRNLTEAVRPVYGIDQSDREVLGAVADREFDGEPIDLVIDDCSHLHDPTRSSFETLFPRLRPGGLYVIEDWNAAHLYQDAVVKAIRESSEEERAKIRESMQAGATMPEHPGLLSQLAIEFVLARASSGHAIDEVIVDEFWITVRRGPGELDPATFRLDDLYTDYFGLRGWT